VPQSIANPFAARLSFIINIHISNARDERTAERRQRQSEGTDALWAQSLLRKLCDQHRRSAQSHSYALLISLYQVKILFFTNLVIFSPFWDEAKDGKPWQPGEFLIGVIFL